MEELSRPPTTYRICVSVKLLKSNCLLFSKAHSHYIKSIKEFFAKPSVDMAFMRIDIKDFFPTIDHDILLKKVRGKIRKNQLIHLIHSAISTPTANAASGKIGVPQGLSISNILDDYEIADITKELSSASGRPEEYYKKERTEEENRRDFAKLINYQTRLLEKDLIAATGTS